MLASEYDNIRPDIVLLGKALSGGGAFILLHISLSDLPSLESIPSPLFSPMPASCCASNLVNMVARMAGTL